MSTKPNYFKIGLFVIIAVLLIMVAVIVFGSGLFAEEKVFFETCFDGSVSGLDIGAPVEVRGVRIGQVEQITFVRNAYDIFKDPETVSRFEDYVLIICSADKKNLAAVTDEQRRVRLKSMVRQGLRLRLASNILTGKSFLQADYLDPERYPPLEIRWEPKYPYIPSAPGQFTTIKHSVDKILQKLEKIDTEKIGRELEEVLVTLKEAVRDANVPEVTATLNKMLEDLDNLILTKEPNVEKTLENLRHISANLKDLSESLKRHPSQLLFSEPPPKSEALK